MDGRCLAEMVTEKLLQSHVKRSFSETETCSEGTWKNERETLPTLQVHENDSLNGGTNYDDSLPPKMVKIDQTSTQCTLNSSKTATSSLPATQKVVHVRNMNHIKFRVGKSIRERRSSESYLKTTSVDKIVAETESNSKEDKCVLDDTIRNSGYQISSSPETPEVINGFTIGHENTGCVSGRIESIFDDDELSVGHTGGNSDSKECAVTDPAVYDRKENVASLEDNLKSMDVDDNCDKNVASLNGTKLSQNVGTTVSAASEQRGNSVPVREFNHIKFRVGKRTKDKRPDAGQPSTGPGHPVPKPSHRQDELQRYCLNDAQPKVFPVTNSSLPTSSALTSTRSSVGTRKPTSLQCSTNGNKSSNADLVRACETKLSSCKLDKNDGPSAATRADIHKQDGLEESLRHLELVVRIITQVR
ncbi:hypothetical protein FHG87_024983 [Trinorchestia longiramus]|nr:hypothetical protein FHG87_024983 [Trinorchestia longiramus]